MPYPDPNDPRPALDPDKTVLAPLAPAPRRQKQPHRGTTILVLGILALLFMPFMPVALVLGCVTWSWANDDLRKMNSGLMDPEGRGTTEGGRLCAIIATIVTLSAVLGLIGMLVARFTCGSFILLASILEG